MNNEQMIDSTESAVVRVGKMFAFVWSIILVASTGVGATTLASYPRGWLTGTSIEISEAPYQVSIHCNGLPTCGGAIISVDRVLTAAHCVINYADCKVRIRSSFRNSGGSLRKVSEIKVHEEYDEETYPWKTKRIVPANDIAILTLGEILVQADKVHQPIALFDEAQVVNAGVEARVTGWSKFNGSTEDHLSARTLQTLDVSLCDKAYEGFGGVPAGQICAAYPGANGRGGCQGDSGSPLVIEGRLAGILSWGNGCAKPYYPGVYTEVAYYRDWIDQNIG